MKKLKAYSACHERFAPEVSDVIWGAILRGVFAIILGTAIWAPVRTASASSFGSIVYAGGTSQQFEGTQTSDTITLSGSVTAGQRVSVNITSEQTGTKDVSGITGPNGEIATFRGKVKTNTVHNGEMWDYIATANSPAGATLKVTWNSTINSTRNFVIYTINGTGPTDVAVVATTSSGSSTAINTTITTLTDADFVAGLIVHQGDNSLNLLNGTAIGAGALALGGSVGITARPFYTIKSPAGKFGPGGTMSKPENVIVILCAFKGGTATSPAPPSNLRVIP